MLQYAIVVARALEKEPVKELDRSSNLLNSNIGSLVCSSIDIISRCAYCTSCGRSMSSDKHKRIVALDIPKPTFPCRV